MDLTNQPDRITLDPSRLFNDILAAHAEMVRKQAEEIQTYIAALKAHDWSHEFSDDHRMWEAGRKSWYALREMQGRLDLDFKVWNQHCHPACKNGASYR